MSIGIYIHVPFCIKKCHYCSFVSFPREEGQVSGYMEALAREMEMRARALSGDQKNVDSVYIGGGTPTCLPGEDLASILEKVFSAFNVDSGAEITVEANPGTVDRAKLDILKMSGVNRLSIGFQACHPDILATLGRIHSYPGAVESFREARRAGFDNINVDLIFGVPGQSFEQWAGCLQEVAGLGPDHISAYGLHLEEGTPLHERVVRGELDPCPEDQEAEMYLNLIDTLAEKGYVQYEISNFALPGRFCRHNLRYWHNHQFLGLGAAAHSYLDGRRFSNEPILTNYIEAICKGGLPVCWQEEIGPQTQISETIFLALRLKEGLDTEEFRKRFGVGIDQLYQEKIRRLEGLGLVERADGRLRLTRRGQLLGNVVFSEFV